MDAGRLMLASTSAHGSLRTASGAGKSVHGVLPTAGALIAAATMAGSAPQAYAQSADDPFPDAPLAHAATQNQAQLDMARAIERMCPNLLDTSQTGEVPALLDVCGNLVGNDGELAQAGFPGYGLPREELDAVMQGISGEELQATQLQVQEISDVQVGNITARLSALRAGLAGPGLSLAGLNIDAGDRVLAFADPGHAQIVPAQFEEGGFLSRLGVFVTGEITFGDKDSSGEIAGFDFDTQGITVGADYRFSDRVIAGAAVGYTRFDAEFDESNFASPGGQELESDGVQLSLFGSFYPTDQLFVDGIASVGWHNYDSRRRIVIDSRNEGAGVPDVDTTATGDFDAIHFGVATNVGYTLRLVGANVTPLVRLEYLRAEIDGFTENSTSALELEFDDQDADSLTLNIGIEADYPISTPFGIVSPNIRAEYVHDFLTDEDGVPLNYANDNTEELDEPTQAFCPRQPCSLFEVSTESRDKDYGIIGAGVAATFPAGWAAFVDWHTFVGLSRFDIHTVNLGLRKEF